MKHFPERDLSMVISTRNRASLLSDMLADLQEQQIQNISWAVIIVDKGSTDRTQSVLLQNRCGLELVALFEPVAGKSRIGSRTGGSPWYSPMTMSS